MLVTLSYDRWGFAANRLKCQGVALILRLRVMRHCCCQELSCAKPRRWCTTGRQRAQNICGRPRATAFAKCLLIFQRRGRPQLQRIFFMSPAMWRVEGSRARFLGRPPLRACCGASTAGTQSASGELAGLWPRHDLHQPLRSAILRPGGCNSGESDSRCWGVSRFWQKPRQVEFWAYSHPQPGWTA